MGPGGRAGGRGWGGDGYADGGGWCRIGPRWSRADWLLSTSLTQARPETQCDLLEMEAFECL
jgi:hypothetical protein